MKTLVKKIGQLRKMVEGQRGEFTLFTLALPEDTIAWDLLAAAKWIDEDQPAALQYLVKQVQGILTKQELLNLSGILLFDSSKFTDNGESINSETGWEANNIDLYGRHIQKAYVFVAPLEDFYVLMS